MMEYIVTFITYYFTFLISGCIYLILNNKKIMFNIQFIMLSLLFSGILNIIGEIKNPILIICINIIFIIILLTKLTNEKIKKSIYYALVIYLMILICDALISILISNTILTNFPKILEMKYFRSILTIPVLLLGILFSKVTRKYIKLFYDKYIEKQKISKLKVLYLLLVISFIVVLFCLNAYNRISKQGHIVTIIIILIFILLIVMLLYLLYKEYQINLVNKKIIDENNYIKSIAKQDEEFKHNLINNLLGIKTVSNKKTNKLIDELISDYKQDYKNITNINDLPNGVQSIIYRKAYEENIEDLNLIVDNSINKELYDLLKPKQYNHLCTAIGILFDNALEAVKDIDEKVIEIIFLEDDENIYFILKNSFSNFIDLEEIGKKSVTTKISGHGIGVNYISKLKTLNIKNEIINSMFVSKLIIKKSKKI